MSNVIIAGVGVSQIHLTSKEISLALEGEGGVGGEGGGEGVGGGRGGGR